MKRRTAWIVPVTLLSIAMFGCTTPDVLFEVPDGFARFDEERVQSAISPEGVRMSARTTENDPPQSLEFWSTAVERHMRQSGYYLLDDGEFSSGEIAGRYYEWLAPLGSDEWVYLTAFCVDGDAIAIVEAAGPYEYYDRYRDDIRSALGSVAIR
jgi:hypothetical protein